MKESEILRIMIVDADSSSRALLGDIMRSAGYEVAEFGSAHESLQAMKQGAYDLVVADVRLPEMNAPDFLAALAASGVDVAAVMITEPELAIAGIECLRAGAVDCVARPFDREDLLLRIRRAVERHWLLEENQRYRQELETRLGQYAHDTRRLFLGAVESLASALEARDPHTRGHSARVADLAVAMALPLGLSDEQRERLRVAGQLHDIGKIGIPDGVLKKTGPLTRRERAQIQMHPIIAVGILSPVLADAETVAIIRHHHERVDGAGYPDGLAGAKMPLGARVLAAADAFDAMTSERPYRAAYTREHALDEMRRCAGLQLDTAVVSAFHVLLQRRENGKDQDPPPDASAGGKGPPSPELPGAPPNLEMS
ncbi:MAG TPA: HD domain-containing phosphohydrolase [Armatimonadota bacterium]|nr:HD domain-containing phosphohydrolase [Armatimonadota bacterium]